jgi:hypothetical protein
MTAILGLNSLDGVLMMADTEEFLGGGAKSQCDKLYRFIFKYGMSAGTVITGGAGDSHLIDCANQEMHRFFAQGKPAITEGKHDLNEILDALNEFARTFFCETLQQYQGTAEVLIPSMEMLIAVSLKQGSYLFCWKQGRVNYVSPPQHMAIGSGVVQLHPMLRDIQFSGTKECMFFHGIRMMYQTKRAVLGVGGKTEAMALLNDGATLHFGTDAAQKTEELIINFDEFLMNILYMDVSVVATNVLELDGNVEKSLREMPQLLKQYRDAYRKILYPNFETPKKARRSLPKK